MPVSSEDLLIGKLEIELDELTISFYCDRYSECAFSIDSKKEVSKEKAPKEIEELEKLLSSLNKKGLKIKSYKLSPDCSTCSDCFDKAISMFSTPNQLIVTPCLIFKENASYHLILKSQNKESFSLTYPIAKNYISPYKGEEKGYILNFDNQLFYCYLTVKKEEKDFFKIPIFIFPKKLKLEEVKRIIEELLEWQAKLIYDLEPTGLPLRPGEYEKCVIQKLNFIRYLFRRRNMKGILNSIIENPHRILVKEEVLKEVSETETPLPYLLLDLATESTNIKKISSYNYHFKINNDKYLFVKTYEEKTKISYDTYPNRFVKFFLKFLRQELNNIEEKLKSLKENSAYKEYFEWIETKIEPSLEEMKKVVNQILNKDFFKEVPDVFRFSSPPQVLLKEYRYQEIFSAYLNLIRGIKFLNFELEELLHDPIRNMPELYEYWCFLKLWQILEKILKRKGGYEEKLVADNKFGLKLKRNIEVKFNEKMILSYNKPYQTNINLYSSYSVPLRPDFTLNINDHLIIFDAKYRVEWIEEIEKTERNLDDLDEIIIKEKLGTFLLGDLYKMHTYREALFYQEIKNKPVWAIALYPGDKLKLFSENRKNLNIKNIEDFLKYIINNQTKTGGVGAIPLKPES